MSSDLRPTWSVRPSGLELVRDASLTSGVTAKTGNALALASIDFDGDGTPDLAVGFRGGRVTIYRGNPAALHPYLAGPGALEVTREPFLDEIATVTVDRDPIHLVTGDFDADGRPDLLIADEKTPSLIWLRGKGAGEWPPWSTLPLPGPVTALLPGTLNRRDPMLDLAVATAGGDGAKLLLFSSARGALLDEPVEVDLPDAARSLAVARIDADPYGDLAMLVADELWIVRGDARPIFGDPTAAPAVERYPLPFAARRLAAGRFLEPSHTALALLADDGAVHVFTHGGADGPRFRRVGGFGGAYGSNVDLLAWPAGVTDELLVIDRDGGPPAAAGRGPSRTAPQATLDARPVAGISNAAAALPLRLNDDGIVDMLFLQHDPERITASTSVVAATFTVTNGNDSGAGSLRQAILNANANPGADRILFNIPGAGPHLIHPASALPAATETVTIDGASQPGYTGTPRIELDGRTLGSTDGIALLGANNIVRGLAIYGWGAAGIYLPPGGGATITEGNYFGLNASGAAAAPNSRGIEIASAGNVIGGTTPSARNVISGSSYGILMLGAATDNQVLGNHIGTNPAGTAATGNSIGVFLSGSGPSRNDIGGDQPGAGNLISGNALHGISIASTGSAFTNISGNRIGTDVSGLAALGNGDRGVWLQESSNNTIGGGLSDRNVISGNVGTGVEIISGATRSLRNTVDANYIGVDASGAHALRNLLGIGIRGDENRAGQYIGNVVSGNDFGIIIDGDQNWVQDNRIGTDAAGTTAVPNLNDGLVVSGPGSTRVSVSGNVISGNGNDGIRLLTAGTLGSPGTTITNNMIGTNAAGTAALGNQNKGISVESSIGTVIGGASSASRNVISGNRQDGVSSDSTVVVSGNYIGLNAAGTLAIPNLRHGIFVSNGANVQIGGSTSQEGNVVSGNVATGVRLQSLTGAIVQFNRIGTTADSLSAVPNNIGIEATAFDTLTIVANNVSGNASHGILLNGNGATVQLNDIGAFSTSDPAPFGNGGDGLRIVGGLVSSIGGDWVENTIRHNGGNGVTVAGGTRHEILKNEIGDNGGLGIDLGGDGATPNDAGDGDNGPNELQNHPELGAASSCWFWIDGSGTLASHASTTYRVDVYGNVSCDPSGTGEGDGLLFQQDVTTNAAGSASFSFTTSGTVFEIDAPPITALTMVATDPQGNTSEFSACVPVVPRGPTQVLSIRWASGSKTKLLWTPEAGATAHLLHHGLGSELPGGGCRRSLGPEGSVGDLIEVPGPGQYFWYVVESTNACGIGPLDDATSSPRPFGPSCCDHPLCALGDALQATCDRCVAMICASDPYCCTGPGLWDVSCVDQVLTVCRDLSCDSAGACGHPLCWEGAPLTAGCDNPPVSPSCVASICAVDPYCCGTRWDGVCVGEVGSICSLACPLLPF